MPGSRHVIVMPFSIIRSARDAGTTPVYSLLLRAAVRSAARRDQIQGKVLGEELTVTSTVDHIRTHLIVTLPQGARSLGVSADATLKNNTVLFEARPNSIRRSSSTCTASSEGIGRPVVELFYESGGKKKVAKPNKKAILFLDLEPAGELVNPNQRKEHSREKD